MSCCSHCGKKRGALKRCSRCKQVSYCGAVCQNAAWKGHKKTCLTMEDVGERIDAAHIRWDWREVLKWEGRMEEIMASQSDFTCTHILAKFREAHRRAFKTRAVSTLSSTGESKNHFPDSLAIVRLETRRAELLGKIERFRDQGKSFCIVADYLHVLGKRQEAAGYLQRARKIAEAHGFFSVECESCLGLGKSAIEEGREEEGLELMRNALVCAPLCEEDCTNMEQTVLHYFTDALLDAHAIDEVEPLVARFRAVVQAYADEKGRFNGMAFRSLYASARLHEARGRPQEAAREVRALLDLMRDNGAEIPDMFSRCLTVLRDAAMHLKILDPEHGEKELIELVKAAMAKLSLPLRKPRALRPQP